MITDRGYVSAQLLKPLFMNPHTRTVLSETLLSDERYSRSDATTVLDSIGMVEEKAVIELLSRLEEGAGLSRACVASAFDFDVQDSTALHRLFLCSNTLREGLHYLERFSLLMAETMETAVARTGSGDIHVNIRMMASIYDPTHRRMTMELVVSTLLSWFQQLCGHHLTVKCVTLPEPKPECDKHYQGQWGVAVAHEGDACSIYMPEECLDIAVHNTNPNITQFMKAEVETQLRKQVRSGSLAGHIYQTLVNGQIELHSGQQDVADFYHISPRTLNRHLQNESTTLKQLVTRVRVEKARELLMDHELTIDDIARKLGLSGRRTLDRIFMRAERVSPAQYRHTRSNMSGNTE